MMRFILLALLIWVVITAAFGAFMVSPYWINGWEVPTELWIGSIIFGLWGTSLTMLAAGAMGFKL